LSDGGGGVNVNAPMKHVVVAGGGVVAWSAAAALKRRIPSLKVTVISCPVPPDALADQMMNTLPSIADFHQDLGLGEGDTIYRAMSGLRIGTLFEDWSAELQSYVHAYGSYGSAIEGIPFHQLWLRARARGAVDQFDQYSAAAELGRLGRIGAAEASMNPKPEIGYGLRLTLQRYRALMRDYALHLGADERSCVRLEPKLRGEDGFVDTLVLDDGLEVTADLFVDCTGPAASIRAALDDSFEDWSVYLPCDRLIHVSGEPDRDASLLDRATATTSGWRWETSSPTRSSRGAVYASTHSSRDRVLQDFGSSAADAIEINIRAGRWSALWLRNCVAIGDAAATVEPLEWTNLHLAHSQIDRLISMMPGTDCAPVELAEYNRQCGIEADRVRDFICMHYLTGRRDDPFWKDVSTIKPTASLAHTLALFAERGRLPYYEEETFSRESWAAVLLGQGFNPRRIDPLADSLSLDRVKLELDRYAGLIRQFVAAQPRYSDYLSNVTQESV
jgi:tryptophan 7-halogenase